MVRYIHANTENTNANMFFLSQEELEQIFYAYLPPGESNIYGDCYLSPQSRYELASELAQESANPDNFFVNSVGFWTKKSAPPKRPPDHDSSKLRMASGGQDYYKTKGSQYWYTPKGVYRKSNHWGSDVASCSWYIEGRRYRNDGVVTGNLETAFIAWSDIKPLGWVCMHTKEEIERYPNLRNEFKGMTINDIMFRPIGFTFRK